MAMVEKPKVSLRICLDLRHNNYNNNNNNNIYLYHKEIKDKVIH